MTTQSTFNGREITNVISVTKERADYGQWTLRAKFQTEDGQYHTLAAHCTDSRLVDNWNDAIADDDMTAIEAIKVEVLAIILDKN